jgi:hypothetical protein
VSADADRIAALEAELAEARASVDFANTMHSQATHKLLAELATEREEHERTKADYATCADVGRRLEARLNQVLDERDAAQAEAAAMREAGTKVCNALLGAESWINFDGPDGSDLCLCFPDWDPDTDALPSKPDAHGIVCAHFRDAIYSWRAAALDAQEPK